MLAYDSLPVLNRARVLQSSSFKDVIGSEPYIHARPLRTA
jgi:hypothetical protein